jgi:hypothetical protein
MVFSKPSVGISTISSPENIVTNNFEMFIESYQDSLKDNFIVS